jgi:prickle
LKILLFFDKYPEDQIPRLGSHGEKWREKALMFQIPKQDISANYCSFLANDLAIERYQQFINERNEHALDIGVCFVNEDNQDLVNSRFIGLYVPLSRPK